MTTLTIQIPDNDTELFKQVLKKFKGKIVEEKSAYDPQFVAKVKKARAEKGGKTVTADNLWQAIK